MKQIKIKISVMKLIKRISLKPEIESGQTQLGSCEKLSAFISYFPGAVTPNYILDLEINSRWRKVLPSEKTTLFSRFVLLKQSRVASCLNKRKKIVHNPLWGRDSRV